MKASPGKIALETPELLLSILVESDLKTCVIAACVNKKWNECAIRELWRILPSPQPLFEQLAELGPCDGGGGGGETDDDGDNNHTEKHQLYFSRNFGSEDWARALPVFTRLRALRYHDGEWPRLHPAVFARVGLTRPVLHFLPSLQTLELELEHDSSLSSVPLFFAPTLTRLSLRITGKHDDDLIEHTIGELRCLSHLKHLELFGCLPRMSRLAATLNAIQSLEHVESVHIQLSGPMFAFVFAVLSRHPKLKHATLSRRPQQTPEVEQNEVPPPSNSHETATLKTLVLNGFNTPTLSNTFDGRQFEGVRELKATEVFVQSSKGVRKLLSKLVTACPLLEVFHVSFKISNTTKVPFALEYHSIEPIVHAGLRDLHISYTYPLILSRSDIGKICQILGPSIEVLSLNPSPTLRGTFHSLSNLSGLFPIARNCHRLRRLAIFLDAAVPSTAAAPSLIPRFSRAMKEINFGKSILTERVPVAKFLISMSCPPVRVDQGTPMTLLDTNWTAVSEGVELMRSVVEEVDKLRRINEELQVKLQEASVDSSVEEEVPEASHTLEDVEGPSIRKRSTRSSTKARASM